MTDPQVDDEAEVLGWFRELPDPEARERLVKRFLPLAEHLAGRFAGRGESREDLTQVASLGLVQAIDRFDPDREVRFSTFAAVTIVGELKRYFRDRGWSIRVPRTLQEAAMVVNRTITALSQELGRSPTIEEIAERADLSPEAVLEATEAVQAYSTASLQAPIGEDGTMAEDLLGDEDPQLEMSAEWMAIAPAVQRLPERERKILYLRFFKDMTQTEIAQEVGISQMHVSRLLSQSLAAIRDANEGPEDNRAEL